MAKRTRITIETHSVLIIRGRTSLRVWCPQCGAEAEMLTLTDAAVALNRSPAAVQGWMASADLHHTKAADGTALICLKSMLQQVRRTREAGSALG